VVFIHIVTYIPNIRYELTDFAVVFFIPPSAVKTWRRCELFYARETLASLSVKQNVSFEVLTAVLVMRFIFWDITSCSPFRVNRSFGATSERLKRIQTGNQHESVRNPEDGGSVFYRNVTINGLRDVISLKM
jgi:hypothetical protein